MDKTANKGKASSCDHTVAYMHEFITQSEIVQAVKNECYGWNEHGKTMADLTGNCDKYTSNYKPIDFLDRRRNYMTIFNNCPYCSELIDWRKIKAAVKLLEND